MNFIQETFNFFIEAQKAIKSNRSAIYFFAKRFIADLDQKLLKTKQSQDPQKTVKRYLVFYRNKIKLQNEKIKLATEQNKSPKQIKTMRWKLQMYKKAYNDFNLLKNIQPRKK